MVLVSRSSLGCIKDQDRCSDMPKRLANMACTSQPVYSTTLTIVELQPLLFHSSRCLMCGLFVSSAA